MTVIGLTGGIGMGKSTAASLLEQRLIPDGDRLFQHTCEGDDDMPAHVRTALPAVNLSIPIANGQLALGTWQGIYLWEHRTHAHRRRVIVHLLGE